MLLDAIHIADARDISRTLRDDSVDLIFTDPVYTNLEDYHWLAETAMRVLKPNSVLLAFCSTRWAAQTQLEMERAGLTYQWTLYYVIPGKPGALHLYGLYPCTTPCLLFAKGHRKASPYLPDTQISHVQADHKFKWQKNLAVILRWMAAYSKPGDVVLDPFAGSGSILVAAKMLDRRYIGYDINPERVEEANERLALTNPPLPFWEQVEAAW